MVDDTNGAGDAAAKAAADKAAADAAANNTNTFDPSKIPDDQFSKIFEDKRTFTHPRFKELTEAQKELKARKEADAKAEEERMIKNQEFEKLAKQKDEEIKNLKAANEKSRIDTAITTAAIKLGIGDVDAALKLIERSGIKPNEDGSIAGIEEAFKQLLTDKPYLKNIKNIKMGGGTNPQDPDNGDGTIKMSQIQDPKFYQANRDKIAAAQKAGKIVDDRPGAR